MSCAVTGLWVYYVLFSFCSHHITLDNEPAKINLPETVPFPDFPGFDATKQVGFANRARLYYLVG